MLTIRLARIGKKKQPLYRLIINEKTKDTLGDFLEILGTYNPRSKEVNFKADRIKYWISKGANASDTVHNLLVNNKIIDAKKVKAWRPKKKEITEKDVKSTPPVAGQNAKVSEAKPNLSAETPQSGANAEEPKNKPDIEKPKSDDIKKEPEKSATKEVKTEEKELQKEEPKKEEPKKVEVKAEEKKIEDKSENQNP